MKRYHSPTCCGEVITNTANNKEFFYCRGCKNEVRVPKADLYGRLEGGLLSETIPKTNQPSVVTKYVAHKWVEVLPGIRAFECSVCSEIYTGVTTPTFCPGQAPVNPKPHNWSPTANICLDCGVSNRKLSVSNFCGGRAPVSN